jgi:alpha,alpha-trehalase
LLYLPHPYVVPGGRFNEMYGWDSLLHSQLGLLRDGELELAKNLVDNFLYQIRHYGAILNATAPITSAAPNPPFLTQMLLGVYANDRATRDWLRAALRAWSRNTNSGAAGPHSTPVTGLSRILRSGRRDPLLKSSHRERDCMGRTHYERIHNTSRTTMSAPTTSASITTMRRTSSRAFLQSATAPCASPVSTRRTASGPSTSTSSTTIPSA